METESLRRWRSVFGDGSCDVPSVADRFATRSVVLEHGHDGPTGALLCYGNIQIDPVLRDHLCCTAWLMAIPQSLRRRGFL